MRATYTAVSLFSGLGGLDLGFEAEGFSIVWANDVSHAATKSYERNFRRPAYCKSIREIPISDIPDADVIFGGPPCQSFSLVGRRASDDPRGELVLAFRDIVLAKRPRAFVMENVPGLAASRINNRRLTDVLADDFRSVGYHVAVERLTATDFFVPQRRKRIFLIGSLSALAPRIEGAAFCKSTFGFLPGADDLSANAAIGDLGACVRKGERAVYAPVHPSRFASLMRRQALVDFSLHECPRMSATDTEFVKHIPPGGNFQDVPNELATSRILRFKESGGRTTTYGRLHPDKPSYTINTYFRRPNVGANFHYSAARLITAREAMRFQALPDHFELVYGSTDERNALIGNAVPSHMGQAVAQVVRRALSGEMLAGYTRQLAFGPP